MRRLAFVAVLAMATPLLAQQGSAQPSSGWTTYQVRLAPLPDLTAGCQGGVAGVHVDRRSLVAQEEGRLEVEMPDVPGDFDIGLLDAKGRYVGSGGFGDQTFGANGDLERAFARVTRGQQMTIAICNWASAVPDATVRYRVVPRAAPAPPRGFRSLRPGTVPHLRERVPVNVVLVGYGSGLDVATIKRRLPRVSRPHERVASFYGLDRPLGITYTYDYRFVRAAKAWQDQLFSTIAAMGGSASLTAQQLAYNRQPGRASTVSNPITIPAEEVERWLALHPPPGVDTSRNTVFLMSWWGRPDFRFHTYARANEPISDTGRRANPDVTALVAWGGSTADDPENGLGVTRRVWFHDLSAGPDYWTGSWNIDPDADVDGDGSADRRLLPVWEYGRAVPARQLTTDLADLLRYVAVDLLLTPSPLYSVRPQGPFVASTIGVAHNVHALDGGGSGTFQPGVLATALRGLSPLLRAGSSSRVLREDPVHAGCFAHWRVGAHGPGCMPEYRYAVYSNLFVYHAANLPAFAHAPRAERDIPVISYHLPDVTGLSSPVNHCFAYADDNNRDGTPSMAFGFLPEWCRSSIGSTDLYIHELGHLLGLSHPHDGYDYEEDRDFGSFGEMAFTRVGDEVSTAMHYLFVENEFGQFDRDNWARWSTAGYLAATNAIAKSVLASHRPDLSRLRAADSWSWTAERRFAAHDYSGAIRAARQAWEAAVAAAGRSGVPVRPSSAATDLVEREMSLAVPKQHGYARAHLIDRRTGLPSFCTACVPELPAVLHDRPGGLGR